MITIQAVFNSLSLSLSLSLCLSPANQPVSYSAAVEMLQSIGNLCSVEDGSLIGESRTSDVVDVKSQVSSVHEREDHT